jgi:hypothetical protein
LGKFSHPGDKKKKEGLANPTKGFLTSILCFQVGVQPTWPMFQLDICLHYHIWEELIGNLVPN